MESKVNLLIEDIHNTYTKLIQIDSHLTEASSKKNRGLAQQLLHTKNSLYRKLYSLKCKLIGLIRGTICNIKYEYQDNSNNTKIGEAILLNLSDQDIEATLILYCKLKGMKFNRILEIQRIPTKLI